MTIIAFVHIPKAAGTTLIHILRKTFFLRHIDVRPLAKSSDGILKERDMKIYLRINPLLKSISGHSIRITKKNTSATNVEYKYIILLRNPVDRYLSHYQYGKDVLHRSDYSKFERYLVNKSYCNLQLKYISNDENMDIAKNALLNDFSCVGVTESFNEFLSRLDKLIHPSKICMNYKAQNESHKRLNSSRLVRQKLMEKYHNQIIENNSKDIELYNFVLDTFVKKDFVHKGNCRYYSLPLLVDYFIRKTYYNPITGAIRILNGMKYSGSH